MSSTRSDRSATIAARIQERFRGARSDRRTRRAQSEAGITRLCLILIIHVASDRETEALKLA
jgi:hypothetical protein